MAKRFLSVGDIVGFYSPTHANRGNAGDELRHGIVLGLEIDEGKNNKVEGLWLCRLSDRLDKIRPWDFILNADEIVTTSATLRDGEWVARTHQIHLIPMKREFFGDILRVSGRIVPDLFDRFAEDLHWGQNSPLSSAGYGPRLKMHHTVVKASIESKHSYRHFDYAALLKDGFNDIRPLAIKEHESALAERESLLQDTERATSLQQGFHSSSTAQTPPSQAPERVKGTSTPTLSPQSP